MKFSHTETNVLLIGRGLREIDRLIETLTRVGAEVFFADDATEGLRLMSLERPDVVVCHIGLPDADATALCFAVRSNENLKHIPLMFAGEPKNGAAGIFKALNAGADDFISDGFDADAFIAKLVWMMEQHSNASARREHYESLRRSQMQTLEIVRETTAMFRCLEAETRVAGCDEPRRDERIELGMGMIAGLANLLEEQMRASDRWFGAADRANPTPGSVAGFNDPVLLIEEPHGLSLAA